MQTAVRSLTMNVFCGDENIAAVRALIARYRAACRQMFAAFACGQAAGARIEDNDKGVRLTPENERSRVALAAAFGAAKIAAGEKVKGEGQEYRVTTGAAAAYEMRDQFRNVLYPGSLSFVWDSARQQTIDRWKAKDPEFPSAARGWLVLQGARNLAYFRGVGIEFPQATGRPKLLDRSIVLKWDSEIGAVEFKLGKLDPRRWHTWTKIRDGAWKPGTVILNERDGGPRITISYHRLLETRDVDPERSLTITVSADAINLSGPGEIDQITCPDAIAMLTRLKVQRELWERRRASCGSPRRPWGNKKAWRAVQSHLERVTLNRDRFTTDCNHAWTRRIASRALSWRCGAYELNLSTDGTMGGHSWPWHQFGEFLKYKLAEVGSSLTIR